MKFSKIAVYFLVIGFFSCGLSDIPTLGSASISLVLPGVFSISHNTSNTSDSFLGYNVYYKLPDAANISTINADRSYMTDSSRNPTPSVITGRGFRRIVLTTFNGISFSSFDDDDSDVILSPRPKANAKTYYIDFSAGDNAGSSIYPAPVASSYVSGLGGARGNQGLLIDGGTTTFIQRRMNGNAFLPFFNTVSSYQYAVTDNDIASMIPAFSPGLSIAVVIAVIPYGIDFASVQRIYGTITVSDKTSFDYTTRP